MKTFEELGVCEEIRRAIEEMGFVQPMPVQEEVIPYLLGNRNDVIALAQTGTGKTAAFGIPVLQRIDVTRADTQALILSPTRELEKCVMNIWTGDGFKDVPADRIGPRERYRESIDAILEGVPEDRNTLLFSATMSKEIERIAKGYLHDYKEIVVGSRNEGAEHVNHIYYMVNAKDKYLALKRLVDYYPRIFAIIFCRTKIETQEVADKLIKDGYNAEALHGDLSQQQRDLTMQKFRQHTVQLLVATDVAARGLDVDDLTHVINYGLPDDIENYTHRSGRTGRAGKKGTSLSIVHIREKHKIRNIEKEIGKQFEQGVIPSAEEICKKQLYKVMDEIVKADVDDEEIGPFMQDIQRYFEYIDEEELIKKIVSMEFGKFLSYYADAPEIEEVKTKKEESRGKREEGRSKKQLTPTSKGYKKLFINLGKKDGFYPGELMQTLNRFVGGRQEVGHIDLLDTISYFEVPEKDAKKVMIQLTGIRYKGRTVRCNDAAEGGKASSPRVSRNSRSSSEPREPRKNTSKGTRTHQKEEWMELMNTFKSKKFKGEIPDFEEEGWAIRKPRKKK